MSSNCFLKQKATAEILSNVASFCSECYAVLAKDEIVFYDMRNYCYLCASCQESMAKKLDENCELISSNKNALFS